MNKQTYFEQFVGDTIAYPLYVLVTDAGLDEFRRKCSDFMLVDYPNAVDYQYIAILNTGEIVRIKSVD